MARILEPDDGLTPEEIRERNDLRRLQVIVSGRTPGELALIVEELQAAIDDIRADTVRATRGGRDRRHRGGFDRKG